MPKCPKCKYLHKLTDSCPTEQEKLLTRRLIEGALQAEQIFTLDELERYAEEHKSEFRK